MLPRIGEIVTVRVEIPRRSFLKRRSDGSLDFLSPLPSPFNYGSVPGTLSPDGEPLDAIVLGPKRPLGYIERCAVAAIVRFVDAGVFDPKLVCAGEPPLRPAERAAVARFFRRYVVFKKWLNAARGRDGRTAYEGIFEA